MARIKKPNKSEPAELRRPTYVGPLVLDKKFVEYEQSGQEASPLFVNQFQCYRNGMDFYIDAGVVPVDDLLEPKVKGTVRWLVSERMVMSPATLVGLRDKINLILKDVEIQQGDHETPKV